MILASVMLALSSSIASAGEYAAIAELGIKFLSGKTVPSLTGSQAYMIGLRAEKAKGFMRAYASAEFEYSSGTARFSDTETPSYTHFGGSFVGGVNFFPFSDGLLLPFVGAGGLLGWNILKLTGQQASVEANTEGLSFGYEISGGCDIRKSAGADSAIRIRTGYWQSSATLAGQSGFLLSGWRLSVGFVF